MELGKFLVALAETMSEEELPVWIQRYILALFEATLERMKEAEG